MMNLIYKSIIEIDNKLLCKDYIASLNKNERELLVEPLFKYFRELGFLYPDLEIERFKKEYKKLVEYCPDIDNNEIYNNCSLATCICQYFCRKHLFNTSEIKGNKINNTFIENFNNDDTLRKICINRLGLGWYDSEPNSTFNITPKMVMYQGQRSMRLVPTTSQFKPGVAKAVYLKYSNDNDIVFDYSAGWGGRVLGALSCNRRYIGVDPLTVDEIKEMLEFLEIDKNLYKLIKIGSEDYLEGEDTIDFAFSSPPYYNQEYYSRDLSQAYNKGEDYFYNTYWLKTLRNIKRILKKDKYFAFNIIDKYNRMIDMAKEEFGDIVDTFYLRTVRSHLNKKGKEDAQKYEPIYVFKNNK